MVGNRMGRHSPFGRKMNRPIALTNGQEHQKRSSQQHSSNNPVFFFPQSSRNNRLFHCGLFPGSNNCVQRNSKGIGQFQAIFFFDGWCFLPFPAGNCLCGHPNRSGKVELGQILFLAQGTYFTATNTDHGYS